MANAYLGPPRSSIRGLAVALALLPGIGTASAATPCDDQSISALLAKVVPSVVAIHVGRVTQPAVARSIEHQAATIERAEGSGFIVSDDGFIATNKHVVVGAYEVSAALADGRTMQAEVVYQSPVIDLAFLKIQADHPLPAATLARDDMLKLGQRVVAVGNPDGLGISASAGIVSALDRNLKQSPYDRYIQTDAAINPGNSGGPLFDLRGEVVGMNSISWTQTEGEGSNGLGFAIPGSSIAFLIDQLRRDGRIRCGTLGIKGQKLTSPMRDAIGFPGSEGIIIAAINEDSAAARVGLRVGDVIRTFDGLSVSDITALNHATCIALGRAASMEVWRQGTSFSVHLADTEVKDITGVLPDPSKTAPPRFSGAGDLGLTLRLVDEDARRRFKLGAAASGLVVTAVAPSSVAEAADFSPGDLIRSLQMVPLKAAGSFDEVFLQQEQSGHSHLLALVSAGGVDRWITLPAGRGGGRSR